MRKLSMLLAAAALVAPLQARAQATPPAPAPTTQSPYSFEEVMIPARDGARLQTVILRPRGRSGPLPMLL